MVKNYGCKPRVLALISLFLLSILGVIVYAQPEGSGNVHGTVLDENDVPLQNVKVMAYTSSGSLKSTKYTDSEGYFRFALVDSGQYTIYFEKEGYVTKQISINVPAGLYFDDDDDPVKMGDIILHQNLRLTSSVLSRLVYPGEITNFPFTVSIVGDEPEEIEFYVSCLEGWETRVLDSSSEVRRAQLSSGSLSLTLEVAVPETASDAETVSLTVIGRLNTTLNFTIIPSQTFQHNIEMSSTYPSLSEEIGKTIRFPLTIANLGDSDETIDLQSLIPEGWTTSFITGGDMEVLSLYLESGESESLTLAVEPTEDAPLGQYQLEIRAVSEDGVLRDSINLRVNLKETEGEVELLSAFTDISAEAGSIIEYPLNIWNKGDDDDLFVITVLSAPPEWDTVFKSGDIEVSSFLISAGGSTSLVFEVNSPIDYETGSYNLIVIVESKTKSIEDSLILGVVLREASSDVEIVATFTDVTVKAGSTIAYPFRIRNDGDSDSQIKLSVVSAPSNWDTMFTSDGVEVSSFYIDSEESLSLKFEVEPPRAVEAGDYSIVIRAESEDGKMSEEIELKATVVGSHEISFELSTLYETISIGRSIEFTARITNDGNSPITTVYLDNALPEDWEITTTPSQVTTISPRESATFTLVVETPADTVAGDYLISIQALSDQVESEEIDLRVTAKASTSWGFIGIGLAGVAVIGLVIAFTRFKRR